MNGGFALEKKPRMSRVDLHPTRCHLCGGKVIFTSNARIYQGKEYGSGRCYLCLQCGAHVGTHIPRPDEALGLLANAPMRKGKVQCHELFDRLWKGKDQSRKLRAELYAWLSRQMGIPLAECHFGYFDLSQLHKAYSILQSISNYDAKLVNGKLVFEVNNQLKATA